MIENILYEIDNAFNESENNVLEAIQESCYKALEILENTDDDRDVECFGVFQEAAVAVSEPIKRNNITRNVNVAKAKEDDKKKAEAEKNKNKGDNKKNQKDAVVIDTPKVEKALSEVRKNKAEENLSKLANVNARKIDQLSSKFSKMNKNMKSRQYKAARSLVIGLPAILKSLSDAAKKYKFNEKNETEQKAVQESATGVIKSVNKDPSAKDNTVQSIVKAIRNSVDNGRSINEYDAAKLIDYFVKHYDLTKNDLIELSNLLDAEVNKIKNDLPDASVRLEKEYKKQFKEAVKKLKYIENVKNTTDAYDKLINHLIRYTIVSSETSKKTYAQLRDSGNNVATSTLYNLGATFVGIFEDLIHILGDIGKIFKDALEVAKDDDIDFKTKAATIIIDTLNTLYEDMFKKHIIGIGTTIFTTAVTLLLNSITMSGAILSIIKGTAEGGFGVIKAPLEIKATSTAVRLAAEQITKIMFGNWMMS